MLTKLLKQNLRKLPHIITPVFSPNWLKHKVVRWTLISLVFFLLLSWLLRPVLFQYGLSKAKKSFENRGFLLQEEEAEISGFAQIFFKNLHVLDTQNRSGDTLLLVDHFLVSINPFWGILGQGWISNIEIGKMRAVYDERFKRLLPSNNQADTANQDTTSKGISVVSLVETLKRALKELPNNFSAKQLSFDIRQSKPSRLVKLERVIWRDKSLNVAVKLKDGNRLQQLNIAGTLDPKTLKGTIDLASGNKDVVYLPWKDGTLGFRHIACELKEVITQNAEISVSLNGLFEDVYLKHPRISDTTVRFTLIEGSPRLLLGDTFIQIDSNSIWKLNQLHFTAGARTSFRTKNKQHWALLNLPMDQGKNLFKSLPSGLFKLTHGIQLQGSFSHRFYTWFDETHLEKTQLEADVVYSKDFKVLSWGKANPSKLNGSFYHDYYDGDRYVTSFEVGPNNAYFTPFSGISPLLVESTLRSEDPSFYGHKGFYLEAFQEALKANLREKRFARGGSTISMQLVKNVFLRQHKTLTRKLEEIIIVWLMEHERTVSKTRMLEVYFNIIEWGPGIFGVGEASRYYFGKTPAQLNMGESCYLSSLIPAPSKARWSVDSTGNVSAKWTRFTKLKNRMQSLDSTRFTEADFQVRVKAFIN